MTKNKLSRLIRRLFVIASFVVMLSLTGCWSAHEINDLATVNVIGIDENDAGQVEVTVVIAKPYTLFSKTNAASNEQNKFLIETTTGASIFEAIGKLSRSVPETLYFGHVDAVVFGEQAAREKMVAALDFFKRKSDFRPNIKLLVAKGSASKLVKTMPQQNITLGLDLGNLVHSSGFSATGMVKDISQFMESLSSDTTDPFTGVISTAEKQGIDIHKNKRDSKNQPTAKENKDETSDTIQNDQQEIPKVLSLNGTAVFKGGQLKGFLDEKETRGLLWMTGKLENEIIVLNCGGKKDGTVSLNITDLTSQLTPQVSAGTPRMTVDIQVGADIGQLTCTDLNMNTKQIDRLNQQLEKVVKQDINNVLNKAKDEWQTDIFGFGTAINQSHPKKWKQMAPRWRNGLLKNMEIDLKVLANISRYGLLKDPPKENEAK